MSTELEWTLTQISQTNTHAHPPNDWKPLAATSFVSHKAVFQIFLGLQSSFPWRLRAVLLATVANSLRKESFSSALCFSYSSARDSRETALGSANWFVNVTVVRHIRFECLTQLWLWTFDVCIHWGLDSLILWDVMGELQLNQGLSCWFNSCMIILENMTQNLSRAAEYSTLALKPNYSSVLDVRVFKNLKLLYWIIIIIIIYNKDIIAYTDLRD